MSVGQQNITKAQIDGIAAALIKDLENTHTRIEEFKSWLDTQSAAQLQALGYTVSPDEVSLLKSALADMMANVTDYRTNRRAFSKQLIIGAHL